MAPRTRVAVVVAQAPAVGQEPVEAAGRPEATQLAQAWRQASPSLARRASKPQLQADRSAFKQADSVPEAKVPMALVAQIGRHEPQWLEPSEAPQLGLDMAQEPQASLLAQLE